MGLSNLLYQQFLANQDNAADASAFAPADQIAGWDPAADADEALLRREQAIVGTPLPSGLMAANDAPPSDSGSYLPTSLVGIGAKFNDTLAPKISGNYVSPREIELKKAFDANPTMENSRAWMQEHEANTGIPVSRNEGLPLARPNPDDANPGKLNAKQASSLGMVPFGQPQDQASPGGLPQSLTSGQGQRTGQSVSGTKMFAPDALSQAIKTEQELEQGLKTQAEKTIGDFERNAEAQKKNLAAQEQTALNKDLEIQAEQQRLNAEARTAEQQHKQAMAQFTKDYAADMNNYKQAIDDYGKMAIDPNHFVKNMSTGGWFAATGAGILSAIGQALQARNGVSAPNMAVQEIDRLIDRDIEAQKLNIAKAGNVVGMKQSVLGEMRQKFASEQQAYLATKGVMLDQSKRYLDMIATSYRAPEIQAATQAAKLQIDQQIAANAQKIGMETTQARGGLVAHAANMAAQKQQLNLAYQEANDRRMARMASAIENRNERTIPGWTEKPGLEGMMTDPKLVQQARDEASLYRIIDNGLAQLWEGRDENGAAPFQHDWPTRARAIKNSVATAMAKLQGAGRVRPAVKEQVENLIGNITAFSMEEKPMLANLRKVFQDEASNSFEARYGLVPYQSPSGTQEAFNITGAKE